jgi:hypothetical protein
MQFCAIVSKEKFTYLSHRGKRALVGLVVCFVCSRLWAQNAILRYRSRENLFISERSGSRNSDSLRIGGETSK